MKSTFNKRRNAIPRAGRRKGVLAKTVLVLAPHTDDAELGVGGTIARLIDEGVIVHIVAFSTCEESLSLDLAAGTLKREMLAALPKLGVRREHVTIFPYPVRRLGEHRQSVLEALVELRSRLGPDMVFLPSRHDMHQDHQVVHGEGLRAFKQTTVLGYELPWNNISFDAQAFFVLQENHLQAKVAALRSYHSQLAKKRPYFQPRFIESWARFRGLQVGAKFAETFEVIRIRW